MARARRALVAITRDGDDDSATRPYTTRETREIVFNKMENGTKRYARNIISGRSVDVQLRTWMQLTGLEKKKIFLTSVV